MNWNEEIPPCNETTKDSNDFVLYFGFMGYKTKVISSDIVEKGKAVLLLNTEEFEEFKKRNQKTL